MIRPRPRSAPRWSSPGGTTRLARLGSWSCPPAACVRGCTLYPDLAPAVAPCARPRGRVGGRTLYVDIDVECCNEHVTDTMELPHNYCMSGDQLIYILGCSPVARDECAVSGAEIIFIDRQTDSAARREDSPSPSPSCGATRRCPAVAGESSGVLARPSASALRVRPRPPPPAAPHSALAPMG